MNNLFFTAWGAGLLPIAVWQRRLYTAVLEALTLLALVALAACGPAPPTSQSLAVAQTTVAPPPAPKTLESTLRLGPDVEEIPFYPQIAESIHGDTVAVWEQFDGARYSIWGNSRRAHQDWGRAQLIQIRDSGHSYSPRVAVNAQGQAAAVWVQMNSALAAYGIWSSRLEPGAGWSAAVQVERVKQVAGENAGPAYAPGIAIDDRGHAVAAWQQSDGRRVHVRASRFTPGVGWGQASRLEQGKGDLGAPQVAMDAGGNALVVWPRFHLDRSELWASGLVGGGGGGGSGSGAWDKAMRIDSAPGYVYTPRVMAAGEPGQFAVLWDQAEGFVTGPAAVWASQYQPGRGWRASSATCANRLQALATAGADKVSLAASAKSLPASVAEHCY